MIILSPFVVIAITISAFVVLVAVCRCRGRRLTNANNHRLLSVRCTKLSPFFPYALVLAYNFIWLIQKQWPAFF